MAFQDGVLCKRGIRSDVLWTNPLLYRDPFRRTPIALDTRALLATQYAPRAALDALSERRLADLFKAASYIPFWKSRIDTAHAPADILRSLPVTSKKNFIGRHVDEYTRPRDRARSRKDHTSGSTGEPFEFYFDWRAELRSFGIRERMVRAATRGQALPVVCMRARPSPGFFFGNYVLFYLRGYNSVRHRLPEFIEFAKRFPHGFAVYAYTSSVVELARALHDSGTKLPIRAALATGEGVRESERALVTEGLGASLFLTYATHELKWLTFECEYHRAHVNEEYVHVEVVDEGGAPLPSKSEGKVVATAFDNYAMPFIRYDTGDRGTLSEEPCPCGRTLRTLSVSGRQTDRIEVPGRRIPVFDVSTSFDVFPHAVRQFQIVQKGPCAFSIRVVAGPEFEFRKEDLRTRLRGLIHPDADISWEVVASIPEVRTGKALVYINEQGRG